MAKATAQTRVSYQTKEPKKYTFAEFKQFMIDTISRLDAYEEIKADFIESVQANPMEALEWKSVRMAQAQQIHVQVRTIRTLISGSETFNSLADNLNKVTKYITRDVMMQAQRDSVSTSISSNMVEIAKQAGNARIVERLNEMRETLDYCYDHITDKP